MGIVIVVSLMFLLIIHVNVFHFIDFYLSMHSNQQILLIHTEIVSVVMLVMFITSLLLL